jgi:hypothetical protein
LEGSIHGPVKVLSSHLPAGTDEKQKISARIASVEIQTDPEFKSRALLLN